MNNEGNILSAVSNTRLETRVEPASRCFAIIIRNNTFFHLFARSRSFPLLSELRPPPPILFNPFSLCYSFPFYAASFAAFASFSSFFLRPLFFPFCYVSPLYPAFSADDKASRRVTIPYHPLACGEYCFAPSNRLNVLIYTVWRETKEISLIQRQGISYRRSDFCWNSLWQNSIGRALIFLLLKTVYSIYFFSRNNRKRRS